MDWKRVGEEAATLYDAKLTAYRPTHRKRGGVVHEGEEQVYEDIACRISNITGLSGSKGGAVPDPLKNLPVVRERYVLYTRPGITLFANDRVEVKSQGRTFVGFAGNTYPYYTHGETMLYIRKIVC